MTDSIMQNYNQLREQVINGDRRFQHKDGHLCFEGVDLDALARQYPTPFYVFSEPEIIRNIHEIQQAFAAHKNTKTFFASKTCSVMGVLKAIRDAGICAEANSQYEVRKCLEIGFRGDQIVFNGVVKKPADLEYAIANDLYLINVDSLYELEHIDAISQAEESRQCLRPRRAECSLGDACGTGYRFPCEVRSRHGTGGRNLPPHSGDALCAFARLAYACGRSGAGVRAFRKSD